MPDRHRLRRGRPARARRTARGSAAPSTALAASAAAAGESTTWSKFRRSALNRPATNRPKVSAADRIGVENVEKNSAIAVTIDELDEGQRDRLEHRGIERRRFPGAADRRARSSTP